MPKPVTIGERGFRKNRVEQLLSGWNLGPDGNLAALNDTSYAEIANTLVLVVDPAQIMQQMVDMQKTITDQKELQKFNFNARLLITELLKANPQNKALRAIGDHIVNPDVTIKSKYQDMIQKFDEIFLSSDNKSDNINKLLDIYWDNMKNAVVSAREAADKVKIQQEQHEAAFKTFPTNTNESFKQLMKSKTFSPNSKELNTEVKKAAADLLNINMMLLSRIEPAELNGLPNAKESTQQFAPNLMRLINYSVKSNFQARDDILSCESIAELKNTYLFYIKLLDECIKNKNFNAAYSITLALLAPPTTKVTDKIKGEIDPKVLASFERNIKLMSESINYKNYRQAIPKSNEMYMPIVPVLLRDLTFMYDGNPDVYNDEKTKTAKGEDVENLSKVQMIAATFNALQNNQNLYRATFPVPNQTKFSANIDTPSLSEDLAYELAEAIAPRGKSLTPAEKDAGKKAPPPNKLFSQQDKIRETRAKALAFLKAAATPLVTTTPPPLIPPKRPKPEVTAEAPPQETTTAAAGGPNAENPPQVPPRPPQSEVTAPPAPPPKTATPGAAAGRPSVTKPRPQVPPRPSTAVVQPAPPTTQAAPSSLPPRPRMKVNVMPPPPPLVPPPPPLEPRQAVPQPATSHAADRNATLPQNIAVFQTKLSEIVAFAVPNSKDPIVQEAKDYLQKIDTIKKSASSPEEKAGKFSNLFQEVKNNATLDGYIKKLADAATSLPKNPPPLPPRRVDTSDLMKMFKAQSKEHAKLEHGQNPPKVEQKTEEKQNSTNRRTGPGKG